MDIKDFIIIGVGSLTILRFILDMFGSNKNMNAEQDTKIALLEERFGTIKEELTKVNKKLDNHIYTISNDIKEINKALIKFNK